MATVAVKAVRPVGKPATPANPVQVKVVRVPAPAAPAAPAPAAKKKTSPALVMARQRFEEAGEKLKKARATIGNLHSQVKEHTRGLLMPFGGVLIGAGLAAAVPEVIAWAGRAPTEQPRIGRTGRMIVRLGIGGLLVWQGGRWFNGLFRYAGIAMLGFEVGLRVLEAIRKWMNRQPMEVGAPAESAPAESGAWQEFGADGTEVVARVV